MTKSQPSRFVTCLSRDMLRNERCSFVTLKQNMTPIGEHSDEPIRGDFDNLRSVVCKVFWISIKKMEK